MLDASAQGSILDMYPKEIWELIEKVAEGTRYLEETYKPAPVANVNVHSELQELKNMMAQMMTQQSRGNQQVECKGDLPPRRTDGYQGNNKWQPRQNEGGWQRNNNYDAGQS
ncbi:unnamed protein product [Rhodiola kirilowii]